MSALDELKKKEEKTNLDAAVISSAYYEKQATGFSGRSTTVYSEKAAAELLALRAEQLAAKAMLAKDADIFMQCFKALGLDVSGTDPEKIVDAIKRLKGAA